MWQHVQWSGVKGFAVQDELKAIAITEMKHAEAIAERLFYLGGTPTTKPNPVFVGSTLKEMIARDTEGESNAVRHYRQIIEAAVQEKDTTTARLFLNILQEEEEHHDTLISLLEDM